MPDDRPRLTPEQEAQARERDDTKMGREDRDELILEGPFLRGYSIWDDSPEARKAWRLPPKEDKG